MPLLASGKDSGGGFEPVPQGSHLARCVSVVDMGIQETPWGPKEKVYLGFEVPGVRVQWTKDDVEHEGPALVGGVYTLSLHPDSNLGKNLISWRGKDFSEEEKAGFDLFNILDVACMISVTHNTKGDKTYANIAAIMGVPAGTKVPDRETDLLAYTPQDETKKDSFDKLPNWLKDKCEKGHRMKDSPNEYGGLSMPPANDFSDPLDDDIPF